MGQCVEKIPHDKCGGSKSLQTFLEDDGRFTGFCFKCGTYEPDPYGANPPDANSIKKRSIQDTAEELNELQALPILSVPSRKLGQRTMEYFGVRTSMSEYTGEPVARHYPYYNGEELVSFKTKTLNKDMYFTGPPSGAQMFGWKQAMRHGNTYALFITEGEDDACALFGALKREWQRAGEPAVVSLKNGAKSAAKDIQAVIDTIERRFKQVVLVFDNDDPGRDATKKAVQLLADRDVEVLVASLPLKDANDMVMADRSSELVRAVLFEATKKISTSSYRSSEIWHLADIEIKQGLPWPYTMMTDVTRGIRRGEVYYIGAGVKMGCQS